jgi:hypothetical protein
VSLRDGASKREDWFDSGKTATTGSTTADVAEALAPPETQPAERRQATGELLPPE